MTSRNICNTSELIKRMAADGFGQFARQTITHWTRLADDPMPIHYQGKPGQSNKYDYEEVTAWLRRRNGDNTRLLSYEDERARYMRAKAELAEMQAAEQAGRLVDAEEVCQSSYRIARDIRQALVAMPDRVAAELVVLDDELEIVNRLRAEIEAILTGLRDMAEARLTEKMAEMAAEEGG